MKSLFRIKAVLLALSLIILLPSCMPPAYIPNVVNTPLLSDKDEFQASLHYSTSGYDAQFAYAVTENIGVMLNGNMENWKSDTSDEYHKHFFGETGAGYYSKLGKKGRTEVFGGIGLGSVDIKDYRYAFPTTKSTYTRVFLQPAIGFSTKVVDFSFATRFSLVNMDKTISNNSIVFFEPAITAKVGYNAIKSVFQLSFSIPFRDDELVLISRVFVFSVGVQGFFNKYQKTKSQPF